MILFRLIVFSFAVQAIFALQIDAPFEVSEQVAVYAEEAGAEYSDYSDATLMVKITREKTCANYSLKLLEKGKIVNELESCSADLPNIALQNLVFELFGQDVDSRDNSLFVRIGVLSLFAVFSLLFYYTEIPQPVSLEVNK